jgi:hypothetical protein
MAAPVSVRLDDDVRETLEAEARARHIGLSTYLRVCGGSGYALKAAPSVSMSRARPLCSTMNGVRPGSRTHSSFVATTSAKRVRPTDSRIADAELLAIRRQIALAIGLE